MANKTISDLTAIAAIDAAADLVPIYDDSESEARKATISQLDTAILNDALAGGIAALLATLDTDLTSGTDPGHAHTKITNADDTTTNATFYLLITPTAGADAVAKVSSTKLYYNPSTGRLTCNGLISSAYIDVTGAIQGSGKVSKNTYSLTSVSTEGIESIAAGDATAGAPVRMASRLQFTGKAWDTNGAGSNKNHYWIIEALPISGNPTSSKLRIATDQGVGSYTYIMEVGPTGKLQGLPVSNGSCGTLTLATGAGATTTDVANTVVTADSLIYLQATHANSAVAGIYVSAKTAGTSFTVTHPANPGADANMNYWIVN